MPLRNGKKYLISHLCKCGDLYSNEKFDYKCSECFEYLTKNGIMTSKEYSDKCDEWVKNNTIGETGRLFLLKNKNITDLHLFNLLTSILDTTGKYITEKVGLELFKAGRTNLRGHIVGSFVADWWNIKSLRVSDENKWPSYLDCYYGNYSEDMTKWSGHKTIPPHNPCGPKNDMINNTIMNNLDLCQY